MLTIPGLDAADDVDSLVDETKQAVKPVLDSVAEQVKDTKDKVVKEASQAKDTIAKNAKIETPGADDGLSLFTKLFLGGLIVGACFVFVRLNTRRRAGFAGRHGAFPKGGIA